MSRNRRFARSAVVLFGLALLTGCGTEGPEAPELKTPVGASVDTAVVEMGLLTDRIAYAAAVGYAGVELSFPQDTAIGEITVRVGDRVETGDILIREDQSTDRAEQAELTARLEELEQISAREEELDGIERRLAELEGEDDTVISALDRREREIAAEERTREKERILSVLAGADERTEDVLTAPVPGTITAVTAAAGQTAYAFRTVVCMTDESEPLLITDRIPPDVLDEAVEVIALIGDKEIAVTPLPEDPDEVSVAILNGRKGYTRLRGEGLVPGETGAVVVTLLCTDELLKVPANAVFTNDAGETYVYLLEDDTRVRREIRVGRRTDLEAEVLEGLSEGEIVYVGE